MADDEILKRIDRYLNRGNELMAEVRKEIELTRKAVERSTDAHERDGVAFEGVMDAIARFSAEIHAESQLNREALDRNTEVHRDLRGFIRDIVRRNEQVMGQLIEESRANTREILSRLPPAAA